MTPTTNATHELAIVADLISDGILAINDGYRVRNVELGPSGIPFVRGGDIGDGSISTEVPDHIRTEFASRVEGKLTQSGDIAFISKGTIGRVGRVRSNQPAFVLAPQVCFWRSLNPERLDPTYLFFVVRSSFFQAQLDAVKTHGSMVADYVSLSDQRRFRLPFPPIKVQRHIASILGSLDDKIELNRQTNDSLEAIVRSLFKSWFVDFDPVHAKAVIRRQHFSWTNSQVSHAALPKLVSDIAETFPDSFQDSTLGRVPAGWHAQPLDEVADFLNGLALQKYPTVDGDAYLPVIKISQLRAGSTTSSDKASTDVPTSHVIKDGDLLFSWSGSLLVSIWCGGTGALNQHLFKVTSDLPKWFVHQWLLEHLPSFQATAAAKATTMGHIQRHHLHSALIIVPEKKVLKAASKVFDRFLEQIVNNNLQNRTLTSTRDALLPRLLSGEPPVPDSCPERVMVR